MTLSRRELLRAGAASGALLFAAPILTRAPLLATPLGPFGSAGLKDNYGTRRASKLFPGTSVVHADLHNHTLLSDGDGRATDAYASMRAAGLDVAALTDHANTDKGYPGSTCDGDDSCGQVLGINEASWSHLGELADAAEGEEFTAIRGFEWSSPTLGHMNVWFSETWTDPLHTGGAGQGEGAAEFLHDDSDGFVTREQASAIDTLVKGVPVTGVGMRAFYQWLQLAPGTPVTGGGGDALACFNHPGREPGRFGYFHFEPAMRDRLVSLEVFNRKEDYLFKSVELDSPSPVNQCLNAGWKVGLLGVTDEHGTTWGFEQNKGRTGLWVDGFGRDAVRRAMLERRFSATNVVGLRLDARATSVATGRSARMGGTLGHRSGPIRFEIDLARGAVTLPSSFDPDDDDGSDWTGRTLNLQVLRPSTGALPEILESFEVTVPSEPRGKQRGRNRPSSAPITVASFIDVAGGGDWVILRVADPELPAPGNAGGTAYAGLGKAVAYASPFYLDATAA